MADTLVIRGAREHNLRNVSLELPRDKLIVFTGLSGLGQVVARLRHHLRRGPAPLRRVAVGLRPPVPRPDGQARRRLHRGPVAGHLDRPEVGVAQPALDGRHHHRGLRLPAPALRPHRRAALPDDGAVDHPPDAPADRRPRPRAARGHPLPGAGAGRAGPQGQLRDAARRPGHARASPGPASTASCTSSPTRSTWPATSSTPSRSSSTAWCGGTGIERRLTDSLETALRLAEGVAEVADRAPRRRRGRRARRSRSASTWPARRAARRFDELAPRNFSFNSPYGACEHCDGLGTRFEVDPELVVPNPDLTLDEGAIAPWAGGRSQYFHRLLEAVARTYGVDVDAPWAKLTKQAAEGRCCYGTGRRAGRTSSTRTATAAPAPTTPRTRASSRTCSAGTPRPSPTASASRSRATCARCPCPDVRRRPAQAARRSASPSTAATSPSSATMSIGEAAEVARRRSSCPSATA